MLLTDIVATPHVNTEIPGWEVLVGLGAGVWALIKIYFTQNTHAREIVLLTAKLDSVKENAEKNISEVRTLCSTELEKHQNARKEENKVLHDSNTAMRDFTARLDISMKFMTQAVTKLTETVETLRDNGHSVQRRAERIRSRADGADPDHD